MHDVVLHFLVATAHNHRLKIPIEIQKLTDDRCRRTQAQSPSDHQKSRAPHLQSMPPQHGIGIHGLREFGLDGNSRDHDAVARQAERLHVDFVIFLSHEIPIERPRDPKGMEVKIRNHHAETRLQFPIRDEPGNHPRRHEMGAEDHIGPKFLHQTDQRERLGKIDRETAFVRDPRVIACLIPPAEKFRQHLGEFFVEHRVELLVQDIRVIERIVTQHLFHIGSLAHRTSQGVSGLHMARADRGRQNQNALTHSPRNLPHPARATSPCF